MAQTRAEATLKAVQEQAEASSRSAAAIEQIAKQVDEQATASQATPPWRVEHVTGDRYAVVNESGSTVHAVDIEAPKAICLSKGDAFPADIDGHSRKSFVYLGPGTDRVIVITWRRPDGTQDKWSGEIPPRPPCKR
ncbi:hypothetical protein [Actinomyces wuliandei]|uniref:hypothetical protein n=1 Tax=Actinomyces wuliandei TaxID=2057743 RepID=UPI000FD8F106|nr:hypothetical protein [Actinomyces wuliandei]